MAPSEPSECAVDGCQRRAHSRGLCSAHHHRLVRHGDPLGGRQPRGPCSVVGCERTASSLGLCRLHYDRQRAGVPASAALDHARVEPRSEREVLMDLTGRLLRLGVCSSLQDAAQFAVLLAVHWPDHWPPSPRPARPAQPAFPISPRPIRWSSAGRLSFSRAGRVRLSEVA